MNNLKCTVLDQYEIANQIFKLTLDAPDIVKRSAPGQFINLRVANAIDPLLRRPFSIHRVDRFKGTLDLLYRVVGRGTELMSRFRPGDSLDVMGPLGRSFHIDPACDQAIVIAGGLGAAPVFFLMDELLLKKKEITLLWGARTGDEIFNLEELEKAGIHVLTATEDGSKGQKGYVTDLIPQVLKKMSCTGFTCGPEPMLKQIQEIVKDSGMLWQVSLEKNMACGIGVCQGCATRKKDKQIAMVCSEGPIFDLMEVVFDD